MIRVLFWVCCVPLMLKMLFYDLAHRFQSSFPDGLLAVFEDLCWFNVRFLRDIVAVYMALDALHTPGTADDTDMLCFCLFSALVVMFDECRSWLARTLVKLPVGMAPRWCGVVGRFLNRPPLYGFLKLVASMWMLFYGGSTYMSANLLVQGGAPHAATMAAAAPMR